MVPPRSGVQPWLPTARTEDAMARTERGARISMDDVLAREDEPMHVGDGHDGSGCDDQEPTTIVGTNHADTITAAGGPQVIEAGNAEDDVGAGGGPDTVHGSNGNDVIRGQGGPDHIFGENGDDVLYGNAGPDTIEGGRGDDTITGGGSADRLSGGQGEDTFVYTGVGDATSDDHEDEDTGSCAGGVETIDDFRPGVDKLDFRLLSGSYTFSGTKPFDAEGQVAVEDSANGARVLVNVEGVDTAEMLILLLGVDARSLTADDFLLV